MGILVTPKSQAEVNQLVSTLHSAGYTHFKQGDVELTSFQVGTPAIIWTTSKDYCYRANADISEICGDVNLEVNEVGTYLRG